MGAQESQLKLLLVDDEAIIRKTLPLVLAKKGFDVSVAATVADGIRRLKADRFDVLICDLNIGRFGDGYEVIDAMREVNPRSVTIILTGYPDIGSAVEG